MQADSTLVQWKHEQERGRDGGRIGVHRSHNSRGKDRRRPHLYVNLPVSPSVVFTAVSIARFPPPPRGGSPITGSEPVGPHREFAKGREGKGRAANKYRNRLSIPSNEYRSELAIIGGGERVTNDRPFFRVENVPSPGCYLVAGYDNKIGGKRAMNLHLEWLYFDRGEGEV